MKQQPVVAWAKMAKLDPEQETAFQILTSTFVLDFSRPVQSKRNAWQNWPDRTQQWKHHSECLSLDQLGQGNVSVSPCSQIVLQNPIHLLITNLNDFSLIFNPCRIVAFVDAMCHSQSVSLCLIIPSMIGHGILHAFVRRLPEKGLDDTSNVRAVAKIMEHLLIFWISFAQHLLTLENSFQQQLNWPVMGEQGMTTTHPAPSPCRSDIRVEDDGCWSAPFVQVFLQSFEACSKWCCWTHCENKTLQLEGNECSLVCECGLWNPNSRINQAWDQIHRIFDNVNVKTFNCKISPALRLQHGFAKKDQLKCVPRRFWPQFGLMLHVHNFANDSRLTFLWPVPESHGLMAISQWSRFGNAVRDIWFNCNFFPVLHWDKISLVQMAHVPIEKRQNFTQKAHPRSSQKIFGTDGTLQIQWMNWDEEVNIWEDCGIMWGMFGRLEAVFAAMNLMLHLCQHGTSWHGAMAHFLFQQLHQQNGILTQWSFVRIVQWQEGVTIAAFAMCHDKGRFSTGGCHDEVFFDSLMKQWFREPIWKVLHHRLHSTDDSTDGFGPQFRWSVPPIRSTHVNFQNPSPKKMQCTFIPHLMAIWCDQMAMKNCAPFFPF